MAYTKNAIKNLQPGRLMDESVAYMVMGWRIKQWYHSGNGGYDLVDAEGNITAGWDAPYGFSHELDPRHRWSPSTNIADARRVEQKFLKDGWTIYTSQLFPDWSYVCLIKNGRCVEGRAKEIEHAICIAALLAAEGHFK